MGKFDSLLERLKQSASSRDAETAKHKCPKKKKPAIYVAVARSDTGDGVNGVKVEISKPTKQAPSTNSSGEVKVDPAKKGQHLVRVVLTDEQQKRFAAPQAVTTYLETGRTAVHFFLLEALPTLAFEARDLETNKPVDGVRIRCGRLPELATSGGKADFGAVRAGRYRVTVIVPRADEYKVDVFTRGAHIDSFEAGYPVEMNVDLAPGEVRSFQLHLIRVRTVEFILAEDKSDKPIVGAKLFVKLPGGKASVVETDQLGCARITYTQAGKVEIERIEMREPGNVVKVETR